MVRRGTREESFIVASYKAVMTRPRAKANFRNDLNSVNNTIIFYIVRGAAGKFCSSRSGRRK